MKTVKINRAKWRNHSHGKGNVKLLNADGYMCCLGFACQQIAKCNKNKLLDVPTPGGLEFVVGKFNKRGNSKRSFNTTLSDAAIQINDSSYLSDEERETKLIELFKEYGYNLVFTGEYTDPR